MTFARFFRCHLLVLTLWVSAAALPQESSAAGGLHACNVESVEGLGKVRRSGGGSGRVITFQPIYAGDQVTIREGQVVLRCGAERIVLDTSRSPFVAAAPEDPPDRSDNIMAWISGFLGKHEEETTELSSMQVRGAEPIVAPLLSGGVVQADSRALHLAWQGGAEPFSIVLVEVSSAMPVAGLAGVEEQRVALPLDPPLSIGSYRVEVSDAADQNLSVPFRAVSSSDLPEIPDDIAAKSPDDLLGRTLEAAWLTSVNYGEFVLEGYQRAAALAESDAAARELRAALETGSRPEPPSAAKPQGPNLIAGWETPSADDDPIVRGVSTRATARVALGVLRDLGPAGDRVGVAPPPEVTRGGADWSQVYEKAAPSVAFLALPNGYGSGFVVGNGDWLVTNHHVAESGQLTAERAWQLNAYFARISPQGVVTPIDVPVPAKVHRWDPDLDLALLKLDWASAPSGAPKPGSVRPLPLGEADQPRPGQEVAAIGNAGLGLLWSMKPGHVAAIGTIADNHPDLLSFIDRRLRESQQTEESAALEKLVTLEEFASDLEAGFRDVIGADTLLIQATVPISSGDSGGPLLDETGRVVGISSWGQGDPRSATSTNYFVHGREIAGFITAPPDQPMLEIARDLWPQWAVEYELDGLPRPDAMNVLSGYDWSGVHSLLAVDLDGRTGLAPFEDDLSSADNSFPALSEIVARQIFDAEFGLVYDPSLEANYALYDLDDDGQFEMIRVGGSPSKPVEAVYLVDGERYERRPGPDEGNLLVPIEELPEAWRDAYQLFLDRFVR